jgi:hypothetical protein
MRLFASLIVLPLVWAGTARADWPGRPKADPPRLQQKGPPPAWIETSTRSVWLAYGSYCWTTLCVDMIPPAMRKDIPLVAVRTGNAVRVHLAFVPRTANVVILRGDRPTTLRLRPRQVLVWRPRVSGLALVDVRGAPGSAGYLVRLRLRSSS